MTKPKIDAQEALAYIRSAKSDTELMAIYNLSSRGLQSLFKKLIAAGVLSVAEIEERMPGFAKEALLSEQAAPPKTRGAEINVKEAVADIRAGMDDARLMEKYRLTSKGLVSMMDQLAKAGVIERSEIDARMPAFDATVDLMDVMKRFGFDRASSSRADEKVPEKCVACGAPQTIELEVCPACGVNIDEFKGGKIPARPTDTPQTPPAEPAWICPACDRPQDRPYEECPVCGVIVEKFQKRDSS